MGDHGCRHTVSVKKLVDMPATTGKFRTPLSVDSGNGVSRQPRAWMFMMGHV